MARSDPTTADGNDQVLVVATAARRAAIVAAVEAMGLSAVEADDAYAAAERLCRRPDAFRAVALSLHGLYREELAVIPTVRRVAPRAQVWVADLDGRAAALAEAMRFGVDALLVEDGLHRLDAPARRADVPAVGSVAGGPTARDGDDEDDDREGGSAVRRVPGGSAPWQQPVRTGSRRRPTDRNGARVAEVPAAALAPPVAATASDGRHDDDRAFDQDDDFDPEPGEPVLTAEELRALLQDEPDLPLPG